MQVLYRSSMISLESPVAPTKSNFPSPLILQMDEHRNLPLMLEAEVGGHQSDAKPTVK